jgi:hypothetical protein
MRTGRGRTFGERSGSQNGIGVVSHESSSDSRVIGVISTSVPVETPAFAYKTATWSLRVTAVRNRGIRTRF